MASIFFLPLASSLAAPNANHPFGSHDFEYAEGSIQPSHTSRSNLDAATSDFYDRWKAKYLKAKCGQGRYVVATLTSGVLTVSEAHGYGMLITALMAGHDPQAKTYFDGLYRYFKDHPAKGSKYLMAWRQNTSCHDAAGGGNDSATDGDLDIAYALLLADAQWGSEGDIDYRSESLKVMQAIREKEMDAATGDLQLGSWVHAEPRYLGASRTSDWMPGHFKAFLQAEGEDDWEQASQRAYSLIHRFQTKYAPATGLLPDFVVHLSTSSPRPASAQFLEGSTDGQYAYNACRVPWRLGSDFLTTGDPRSKAALERINHWIRKVTHETPRKIRNGYLLNGKNGRDTETGSMAFVAPLAVGAMTDAKNQALLNSLWKQIEARSLAAEDVYGNSLKLLSMIVVSGNWWAPMSFTD